MSLITRMRAIVGDQNTVARYLFEKVGHTAFIAVALYCLTRGRLPLFTAAVIASVVYVLGAKLWLHWANDVPRSQSWSFLRDVVFDVNVGWLVAVLAAVPLVPWPRAAVIATLWLALFLVLDNNRWGSPS